jgi:hypothetical protein
VKAAALVDVPAAFRTREFVTLRNTWYRKLEADGFAVDELGYKQSRERAKKGPSMIDPALREPESYGHDASAAEQMNLRRFGRPLPAWDLARAEYWRLMAEQVEHLPANYYGTPLLRRWAEIGEIKNAARECGITRWKARRIVDRFLLVLKRKGVLR